MKNGVRIALSLYIGFSVYSILMFLFSQSGLLAFRDVEAHREALVSNIVELQQIGNDLEQRRDLLLTDSQEIELLARRLGYYQSGEVRIVLPRSEGSMIGRVLGRMVQRYDVSARDHSLYRAIGFAVALVAFIVLSLPYRGSGGHPSRR